MADLADLTHDWGEDLNLSVTGDIAVSTTTKRAEQRIARRLLTNPGEYIFDPTYGGGLRGYIGSTVEPAKVRSSIRAQLREDAAVSLSQPPQITITPILNGLSAEVVFTESSNGGPVLLSLDLDNR